MFNFLVLIEAHPCICKVLLLFFFFFALLDGATEEQMQEFLKEILLMKQIEYHPNILNLLACCTMTNPIFLVLEFAKHGDLLHYLRKKREQVM